ncbi:MAG: (2Fe-2S)-binding protein [Spirochaetota bacterium]|nr:(2Fe-2S)-binding protein [Spirochaetota bacterium]
MEDNRNNNNRKADDKDRLICRCEEVTLGEIEQAIEEGCTTLNEVKRRTRAGMGLCQGRTCSKLIARIIAQKTGKPLSEVMPVTSRPPARPVKIDVFSTGASDEKNN